MYDKTELKTIGMTTAAVINPKTGERFVLDFYVTKSHAVPILGAEACQLMNFIIVNLENVLGLDYSVHNVPLTMKDILTKFGDIFQGYGKLDGQLHLVTDPSVPPVRMPLRKLPMPIKSKVKAELQDMVANEIIPPLNE